MTLFEEHAIPLADVRYRPVLAATAWRNNAELILDLARIGYLTPDDITLDATYGLGRWWDRWRPITLIANDLDPKAPCQHHEDFRRTSFKADYFDVTVFDPPYISAGGRDTSTVPAFNARYGLTKAPATPEALQELMDAGLREMHRVTKPEGCTLAKCKDYVANHRLQIHTHWTMLTALALGYEVIDRLEHISGTGPQPYRDYQRHARRNLSTLFVLRKQRG